MVVYYTNSRGERVWAYYNPEFFPTFSKAKFRCYLDHFAEWYLFKEFLQIAKPSKNLEKKEGQ